MAVAQLAHEEENGGGGASPGAMQGHGFRALTSPAEGRHANTVRLRLHPRGRVPPGVPPGSEAKRTPAKTSSGGTAVEDGRKGKTRSQRTNEAKTNEPVQGLGEGGWRRVEEQPKIGGAEAWRPRDQQEAAEQTPSKQDGRACRAFRAIRAFRVFRVFRAFKLLDFSELSSF